MDAAIQQVPHRYAPRKAGLGVYLQGDFQGVPTKLLIQATHYQAQDPLHAETLALELASKMPYTLQMPAISYNTDSQLLATTINSQDPILSATDWRIRPSVAQFINNNSISIFKCNKIPRQNNKRTHNLAKFAWRENVLSCNFTCINPRHSGTCPVQQDLASTLWDAFNPILVNCF